MSKISNDIPTVSKFRREFSQYLYGGSLSLISFNIGLALSYPTLVINAFFVNNNGTSGHDDSGLPFDEFSLTEKQATLYVSLAYLCQPIGSLAGGLLIQKIGRKKVMITFNIPIFIGWITLFCSQSVAWMYVSNILIGISLGFSEAPFAAYVGETTEPHIRGVTAGLVLVLFSFAFLAPYLIALGTGSLAWRWIALYQGVIPLLTLLYVLMVPESPIWLISKGRIEEARRSLQALRGWKDTPEVDKELAEAIAFHHSSVQASNSNLNSTAELVRRKPTFREKMSLLLTQRMLRPLGTVCTLFSLIYLTGLSSIRPYLGPVMQELHLVGQDHAEDEEKTQYESMVLTIVGAVGTAVGIGVMKISGKRVLYMVGLICCMITCSILSLAAEALVSPTVSLWALYLYSFFTGFAIIPIPWLLQCDLYPFEGRGIGSSIAASWNYIVGFVAALIALDIMRAFTPSGMFGFFAAFSAIGFVFAYIFMPETEGKSLQEIDAYYRRFESRS